MANPTVDEIFAQTDIVSLVSEYVTLTKKGKNYVGLCPFHNEKTPSFSVSVDKNLAYCFSCNKGGSPAQFLMDLKHIEFKEAMKILADRAGLDYHDDSKTENSQSLAKYYEITALAKEFYKKNLLKTENGQVALDYLHKRGINDETIKMFDIGLAPSNIDSLYKLLKEANYLDIDMKTVGLVKSGAVGNYDMFSKRIMFPITNERGDVVGFSARLYTEDKTQPKYVNSTESVIFKKSKVLYNLDKASMYMSKANRVVLHEGFMDVFASVNSGIKEAVCSMGTALTDSHAKILKNYVNNVVICYDGDNAGLNAAKKAINVFKRNDMNIHLVLLPDGCDPDEYVRKYGSEAYHEYFNSNLLDPIEFLYRLCIKNHNLNDNNEIYILKEELFQILNETNSKSTVETYLSKLSGVLNVSFESLASDYDYYCNINQQSKYVEYLPEVENNINIMPPLEVFKDEDERLKAKLLTYAYMNREYCNYIDKVITEYDLLDYLGKDFVDIWYQLCDGYYNRFDIFTSENFKDYISDNEQIVNVFKKFNLINFNNMLNQNEEKSEHDLFELVYQVITMGLKKKIERIQQTITQVSDGKLQLVIEQSKISQKLSSHTKNRNKFLNSQIIRK